MDDQETMRDRLKKVAAGERDPYCSAGEGSKFEQVRIKINGIMAAWFQEHNRYLYVTNREIKEQIDASLRAVLGQLSGLAPGLIDIDVDIELHRGETGKIAYAFKYKRVRN